MSARSRRDTGNLHLQFEREAEATLAFRPGVHSYAMLPIGYPMEPFGPVRRIALADVRLWGPVNSGLPGSVAERARRNAGLEFQSVALVKALTLVAVTHSRCPPCRVRLFGSGGDRNGATGREIVAPQSDGESDDGETAYNDCPRLGTKSLEPLRIELDRAEDRRGGDDPTTVGARRPSPNSDEDNRPTDDERDLRYM